MYHKMPLLENNTKEKTLNKIHNQPMLLSNFNDFHLLFQCFYIFFEQSHLPRLLKADDRTKKTRGIL